MPSVEMIEEFLAQRHVAFVGVSRNTGEFANNVYRRLRDGGRVLYPVNQSGGTTLEGDPAYPSVAAVPDPVDGVVIMVPAAAEPAAVAEAISRGIPRVWIHRGVGGGPVADEVRRACRDAGVALIDGACPLMFDPPVRGVHHLHRILSRRRFAA